MKKPKREQNGALFPNDQIIVAGYGMQSNENNNNDEAKHLKFVRFKYFRYENEEIAFISEHAELCGGRS